jgi:uncharacterized protein YndB with AHSA1/START domain
MGLSPSAFDELKEYERMNDLSATNSITIEAAIEEVWRALTTPDQIKRWFFGVDTETDWKVGSPLVHRGEYQGKPYEDKGEIVRFDPPELLVHTQWSDLSGKPDSPELSRGGVGARRARRCDRAHDHGAQPPLGRCEGRLGGKLEDGSRQPQGPPGELTMADGERTTG